MFRSLGAALISGLLLVTWPLTSAAHAHLERAVPDKNSELSEPPHSIQLWFSGNVQAEWSKIEVADETGERVDKDKVTGKDDDEKYLQVELNDLAAGTYHVRWSTLSRDGHRVKGEYSFKVR